MEDTDDYYDILKVKKHLDKLLEASKLISVREFECWDGEPVLKMRTNDEDNEATAETPGEGSSKVPQEAGN
jgi:hypothetical protein